MKCPYCEKDIQPNNMDRHTNTKRCRGIRRCKIISEGDYKDVNMEDFGLACFFSHTPYHKQIYHLGKLTEEEFELKFLRQKGDYEYRIWRNKYNRDMFMT